MNIFDYIKWVSGYIIKKIETDSKSEFRINPIRSIQDGKLHLKIDEFDLNGQGPLSIEFPCDDREAFYEAINSELLTYLKESDKIAYTGMRTYDNSFSIVTKNRVSIILGIENELDAIIYNEFKTYLDEGSILFSNNNEDIIEENFDEEIIEKTPVYSKKIML